MSVPCYFLVLPSECKHCSHGRQNLLSDAPCLAVLLHFYGGQACCHLEHKFVQSYRKLSLHYERNYESIPRKQMNNKGYCR